VERLLLRRSGLKIKTMSPVLRTFCRSLAIGVLLAGCGATPDGGPAELVVRGGAIHTSDAQQPVAQALAVRDGRFVQVGSSREAERWIGGATEVIDLDGQAVIPGLIDGHVHLESGISLVRGVDLAGIADRKEWARRIAARAAELGPGAWIVGGGGITPCPAASSPRWETSIR